MNEFLRTDTAMSALTSMRTGGIAPVACFPETEKDLCDAVRRLTREHKRFFVFGNLSNVLLPDGRLDFVPVITTGIKTVTVTETDAGIDVYAACGVSLTGLALEFCRGDYAGLSFAYGIPGTVGGAVFMNAGAYGSEMKNIVRSVRFYDIDADAVCEIPASDCGFGYRTSVFAHKNGVILGAFLSLAACEPGTALAEAKDFMERRREKQPLEYPSCGSAFKRPEGYFAGELIEKCGLKGYTVGGACVSEKHAGFVVNKGGATSADVEKVLCDVRAKVLQKFGVELEPEIRILK
ncbi:MAG: UDP-N-acetylmuramate dehydrogenase [Eubacteriales bacterium]|jgi:UDP-N-acetylmuramate dehydrogenase